jgi:hypothetical protein
MVIARRCALALGCPNSRDRMTRTKKAALWLALNALGAAAYLAVASLGWVEPALADLPEAHGGGAAFVWFLSAVPVILVFAALNLAVLAWALGAWRKVGSWPFSKLAWLILPLWLCAAIVDFAHH